MKPLYQKNNIILRRACAADGKVLSRVLRPADRAELAAANPGQDVEALLVKFIRASSRVFALEYAGEVAAVFGVCPESILGRRACVWLLTGRTVEKIPKTFMQVSRCLLSGALQEYPELYNFVDGRYASALRFIRHLGGRFEGRFYQMPATRFLYFTFRRK